MFSNSLHNTGRKKTKTDRGKNPHDLKILTFQSNFKTFGKALADLALAMAAWFIRACKVVFHLIKGDPSSGNRMDDGALFSVDEEKENTLSFPYF